MDTKGKFLLLVKEGEMCLETPEAMVSVWEKGNFFEKNKSNSIRKAEK